MDSLAVVSGQFDHRICLLYIVYSYILVEKRNKSLAFLAVISLLCMKNLCQLSTAPQIQYVVLHYTAPRYQLDCILAGMLTDSFGSFDSASSPTSVVSSLLSFILAKKFAGLHITKQLKLSCTLLCKTTRRNARRVNRLTASLHGSRLPASSCHLVH